VTEDLRGTGGAVVDLEDFIVEEIPAYLPSGEGEHTMALVRKQGLTTVEAARRIGRTLGLPSRPWGTRG